MLEKFEMIPCPVCGKPMPKKRLDLGYKYCVNCSTEGRKVCVVEGVQEGEDVQSETFIVSPQEAQLIAKTKSVGLKLEKLEEETKLNLQTYEEQEESEKALQHRDIAEFEGEFGYEISDKVARDMETLGLFDNDSSEDLGEE